MKYIGKLYGKVGRSYLQLEMTTGDVERMMKDKWISVKDRLPEYQGFGKPQTVIVSGIDDEKRYVFYAECHSYGEKKTAEEIFSIPGWSRMNVTHWMPFPEPPKE